VGNKVAVDNMVAVDIVAVAMADASRLVTLAEGMATWRATALKVKSATTAAKLVTSHAIAPLKVMENESATSANSQVTSRLNALTRCTRSFTQHTTKCQPSQPIYRGRLSTLPKRCYAKR